MKKIDMYKEVPEQFHNKLHNTLEQLEEEITVNQKTATTKIIKFPFKKYAVACAVVLLATSTITVGAVEFFKWYKTARESLGTEQELEDKLTQQGAALPAEDVDIQSNIEMKALQAVKTDDDFYLLAALKWPEELQWNDDILFEESEVISDRNFGGMTANFVEGPDENGTLYVEMQLLGKPDVLYEGEVQVILKNLIQTKKTEYIDTLVEAEWKLTYNLPGDADTKSFMTTQFLPVNGHVLNLDKIEVNPFGVRLYTDEEQGRHVAYYSNMELIAVQYADGSRVDNYGGFLQSSAAKEDGSFYFNLKLQNAVDIEKVSGLVFREDNEEFVFALGECSFTQLSEKYESEKVSLHDWIIQEYSLEDLQILYVRHNYVIITVDNFLYLWDAACDNAEVVINLADYGFDAENGGEIAMMPGGVVLAVHPATVSDRVYMVDMDTFEIMEAEGEFMWPVPNYENYKSSFFKVSEKSDLPEGFYAEEGYEAQGGAYVLYSKDGSVENMELLDISNE